MLTNEIVEALLKVIDEGIHVINTDGRTIFYNKVAAAHDGMEVEEVIGKHLLEAFPSLTAKSSTLLQVIEGGKPLYHQNQSYINKHGQTIETINTTLPIYVNGELVGAVEVAKDYTTLRKLYDRLLDLEQKISPVKDTRKRNIGAHYTFDHIITQNEPFKKLINQGRKAARSSSSILVYGESGTGKELFVHSIHQASPRRNQPFIAQNCAAIPDSLLESILFGTSKGSYTGAVERAGLFELSNGGTLFLDEIQAMSPMLQTKLLRVIEDGVNRRVGSTKSSIVDVRVIAAMNIHPETAVKDNLLREDLYYRLNVLSFHLPPLRKRQEDIVLLADYFLKHFNRQLNMNVVGFNEELLLVLKQHNWPGNVRELKHCIEYMMNIAESKLLQLDDLPSFFKQGYHKDRIYIPPLREAIQEKERELIEQALAFTKGNILKAAKLLKIPRQTLQYKIKNQK